jgi:NADH:ubiquinone oxidoreductase subunit F (NADH-binding)
MFSLDPREENILRICDGPACWLKGSEAITNKAFELYLNESDWVVERSSCLGLCDRAPAGLVNEVQVGPLGIENLSDRAGMFNTRGVDYSKTRPGEVRVMMAHAGEIIPDSIESALVHGAYQGLKKSLELSPDDIIQEVEDSGLTGRGGAGYPVGHKWRFVHNETNKPKYIICNADESEPLHFKDRVLIESNPHQVLEGMALAGFSTDAEEGIIYIRGEYEQQANLLESAIQQAISQRLLGENILDTDFTFHIHIHRGAGAYICGEETALIESLEGNRGEPRLRPPYPPQFGYRGYPTLVNNVESFAAIPAIITNGAGWYNSLSDYSTPGTKMYTVMGFINNPGLFEAPFGITLRQIIDQYSGGMRSDSEFYFALTGGAAGTIVPSSHLDIPIDYMSTSQGISLGAGGFLICDKSISPVDLLKEILFFYKVESCGKCTPCRVGTKRSFDILDRMAAGSGESGDIEELISLADLMSDTSFCGLGQSTAIPIKSAISHFRSEFLSTIDSN